MSASDLHRQMVIAINGKIHPNLEDEWSKFTMLLEQYLDDAQVAGIKNAMDAMKLLEREGHIKIGEYNVLLKIFRAMKHQTACDIVNEYTKKIKDVVTGPSNTGPPDASSNPGKEDMQEEKQPEMSKEVIKLHQKMVHEIHGHMHPRLESQWQQYTGMLRPYLSTLEIGSVGNFDDSTQLLLNKKIITYGRYETLIEIFTTIQHEIISSIIKRYSKMMEPFLPAEPHKGSHP